MKKNQNGILELLSDKPLIPVVTIKDLEQLDNTIETLLSRDINCIEITLRTSVSWQAIERAKKNHGDRIKVGKEYKIGLFISVRKDALRKDLEQARIIKGLNSGF